MVAELLATASRQEVGDDGCTGAAAIEMKSRKTSASRPSIAWGCHDANGNGVHAPCAATTCTAPGSAPEPLQGRHVRGAEAAVVQRGGDERPVTPGNRRAVRSPPVANAAPASSVRPGTASRTRAIKPKSSPAPVPTRARSITMTAPAAGAGRTRGDDVRRLTRRRARAGPQDAGD